MPTTDLSLSRYVDAVRQLPVPSDEQIKAFIDHVAQEHSWYKDLPLLPPGVPFFFYLDPAAGMRANEVGGTARAEPLTTLGGRDASMATRDYVSRFGHLAYQPRIHPAGIFDLFQSEFVPLPETVLQAGQAHVSGIIHPQASTKALWRLTYLADLRRFPVWPDESGGLPELIRIVSVANGFDDYHEPNRARGAEATDPWTDPEIDALLTSERRRQIDGMLNACDRMLDVIFNTSLLEEPQNGLLPRLWGALLGDLSPTVSARAPMLAVAANPGPSEVKVFRRFFKLDGSLTEDPATALDWYWPGAEAGLAEAMTGLGVLYEIGAGVARDPGQAADWYRKAAHAGSAEGMVRLGTLCNAGTGVAKNQEQAVHWWRRAAEAGSAEALLNIGAMLGHRSATRWDQHEASRCRRRGLLLTEAQAMRNIAALYAGGVGLDSDPVAAERWLRRAYQKASEAEQEPVPVAQRLDGVDERADSTFTAPPHLFHVTPRDEVMDVLREIFEASSTALVLFAHGTFVVFRKMPEELIAEAKNLMAKFGGVLAGSHLGDFQVLPLKNGRATLVTSAHPDIFTYVSPRQFLPETPALKIGLFGRHMRQLDSQELVVIDHCLLGAS